MPAGSKSPGFVQNSPEIGRSFRDSDEGCREKGILDRKTKELLTTALACVFRCPHCTEEHIRAALDAGATKEEIAEAVLIAGVEGAGTPLAWTKETYMKYLG